MTQGTAQSGLKMDAMRGALADAVVERHYRLRPELAVRFGARGREKCREDAAYHLAHLSQALAASKPILFRDYVGWAKIMLAGRGIPASDLEDNLRVTGEVLRECLAPDDACAACGYVDGAIADLHGAGLPAPGGIAPDQPFAQLARSFLAALLACDRQTASRLILGAVDGGASVKDMYIHVFQQSQKEIGRLWQINQVSVAQEHFCTAATQMIMSQLYPRIFAGPRVGRSFIGACVGGDLHDLGVRMVADFFEMEGWDTVYLGANVPTPDLVRTLRERKPDVAGISATITPHIGAVARAVAAIRAEPECRDIKIIVGGYPFILVPDLWKEVGADGTCVDAQSAVGLADRLLMIGERGGV